MKLKLLLMALPLVCCCEGKPLDEEKTETGGSERVPITVMSYNMLFEHTVPAEPERQWTSRLPNMAATINSLKPDVIGAQEIQSYQIFDLIKATGYGRIGCSLAGTTSETDNNENEVILYNKDRLKCITSGHFWFNQHPDTAGPASGVSYNRMCNWAKFQVIGEESTFYVYNSHFYVETEALRMDCAKILVERISAPPLSPVFLTGDFNAGITDSSVKHILASGYKDSRAMVSTPKGPAGTWYDFDLTASPIYRLDHILVNSKVNVEEYEIIDTQIKTGKIESDHLPVMIHATI